MTGPTENQLDLLQHALGLSAERREPYRNFFVAGDGHHDMDDLRCLEVLGLMSRAKSPSFISKSAVVFVATDRGREVAIQGLPPVAKRSRYDDYLAGDGGGTFGEFLCGVHIPKFEDDRMRRRYGEPVRYRMYRETWDGYCWRRDVEGDWAVYKKDAKASYKRVLAESRAKDQALSGSSAAPA